VTHFKGNSGAFLFPGILAALCFLALHSTRAVHAQQAPPKATETHPKKPPAKQAEKSSRQSAASEPELPAQFSLLETNIRFESNGDSRKEVHAIVKINNELGVTQFARLNFDYNRSFETVEIPLARIAHASGGTSDILPSATSDIPNAAVVDAPAYQSVRVKSVRILGLAPKDILEYRVITTVSHHPLAPDFWLDHKFDRTGVVSHEIFGLDLPASRFQDSDATHKSAGLHVNPATPFTSTKKTGDGDSARVVYRWDRTAASPASSSQESVEATEPDVAYSTFATWERLSIKLAEKLLPGAVPLESLHTQEAQRQELSRKPEATEEVKAKSLDLTKSTRNYRERLEALYDFVSQKIATVDLPIGSTGFSVRSPGEVLSSGYATPEDKFVLFSTLANILNFPSEAALTGSCDRDGAPVPSAFSHLIIRAGSGMFHVWIEPTLEVAPFGVISPTPTKCAFVLNRLFSLDSTEHEWQTIDLRPPFAAFQKVSVEGTLAADGKLGAKVTYSMRGDNELPLRIAFHQAPKEKWKDVAQLLALSDGFRGKIVSATASDPLATKEPFSVEYEIEQPKFVDWSKKPVRIPALLPLLGLPDPPAAAGWPIVLGTPLDVQTTSTLHLPRGTTAVVPTGTSVDRDYAAFSSQYAATENTATASRHIHFLLREVPATRSADYTAFLHAVQSDQAQLFTLDGSPTAPAAQPPPASLHAFPPAPELQ
jgi:hypothetical protein